jgi:tetratricopeptide (TPR) repeat protein
MPQNLALRERPLRVFVSATTQDLGSCRAAVKEELLTAGILPVTQENFAPDYRRLEDFLRFEISRCDAVICLIGFIHGACPSGSSRSFTEIEYDLAVQNDKPVFVFLTDDRPEYHALTQSEEDREAQSRHRTRVMAAGHKWEVFPDTADLCLKVARTVQRAAHTLAPRHPIYYRHLPRTPSFFVGRVRELRQLHEALTAPAPAVVVVIGMGGQGKTTLVHKALLDLQSFPFVTGFWCSAYRGGYTFDMFLDDALSYLLKGNLEKAAVPRPEARVELLLDRAQQEPILLVLDGIERWLCGWNTMGRDRPDAESALGRSGHYDGLDAFLQQASSLTNGSHIVITSRALPSALDDAVRAQIPVRDPGEADMGLEGLELPEAVDMLTKLGVVGSPDSLAKIASLYACHPLALTILGTLSKKKWGGRLDRVAPAAVLDPQRELHRLFDEIRINLPGGKCGEMFLGVASHCIETPTLPVIAAGMPPDVQRRDDELVDLAVALADWSLAWWDGGSQTVGLHPLAKQYFASLVAPDESRSIHERLFRHYKEIAIPAAALRLEDVAPRVLAIRHAAAAGRVEEAYELLLTPMFEKHSMFTWLSAWGHQSFGIELMTELLGGAVIELRGHLLLARTQFHYQLAGLSSAAEDTAGAIRILQKQRDAGDRQVLPDLAKALAGRGSICCEAGRCVDAIPDFDQAIAILEELEATNDVTLDLAVVLLSRANAWRGAGALSRALSDYDRACRLCEPLVAALPHLGPSTFAPTLSSRALCLLDLQRVDLAASDLERAVAICKSARVGAEDESELPLAHALAILAIASCRSEQQERALACATEAVEILDRVVDRGRTDAEYLLGLALVTRTEVCLKLDRREAAVRNADRAVRIYQRLVLQAGPHFEGALAHALCIRGCARYQLGDREASRTDREAGFEIWQRLRKRWPSESEMTITRLGDVLQAVMYLVDAEDAAGIPVVESLLRECQALFDDVEATESEKQAVTRGAGLLAALLPKMAAAGWPVDKAQAFLAQFGAVGSQGWSSMI